jgi:hypothetical protein
VFNAFMPVFWVLLLEIFEGVISCVTNSRVRVRGASRKEFDCEDSILIPIYVVRNSNIALHVSVCFLVRI